MSVREPDVSGNRASPPDAWRVASELYQAGDLFGCHEFLEHVWRAKAHCASSTGVSFRWWSDCIMPSVGIESGHEQCWHAGSRG
jgi:hypothetical protein